MASATAVVLRLAERPLVQRLSACVESKQWGALPRLRLPKEVGALLAVVLLDYTLYLWHILLHRLPVLWRFHLAHHIDLDLDAWTALRFHFGEFLASIPWRLAQVLLIGVPPRALSVWQKLTLAEVVFHHANLRLPLRFEQVLSRLIVTPRLHGIHHSTVAEERGSNFSSGLAFWDSLHGTGRRHLRQARLAIGVPPYDAPWQVTLGRTLLLPFVGEARRESGRVLPGDDAAKG